VLLCSGGGWDRWWQNGAPSLQQLMQTPTHTLAPARVAPVFATDGTGCVLPHSFLSPLPLPILSAPQVWSSEDSRDEFMQLPFRAVLSLLASEETAGAAAAPALHPDPPCCPVDDPWCPCWPVAGAPLKLAPPPPPRPPLRTPPPPTPRAVHNENTVVVALAGWLELGAGRRATADQRQQLVELVRGPPCGRAAGARAGCCLLMRRTDRATPCLCCRFRGATAHVLLTRKAAPSAIPLLPRPPRPRHYLPLLRCGCRS
jgi:hypothetical protein